MSRQSLNDFGQMIRFAATPTKLQTIKNWLNKFFNSSEFWSDDTNTEILEKKNELIDALDYLIETSTESDITANKTHAIKIFTQAAHYEIARTSGHFNEQDEIKEFVSILEWTLSHGWVISQIDPSSAQIPSGEVPRWLINHYNEVIAVKKQLK